MPDAAVPLTTMLSWLWVVWTIELDNAFEAESRAHVGPLFRISLAMWANGLRCIDDDGVTVAELARRTRAACNLPGLERWGWITIGAPGASPRAGFGSKRGVRPDTVVRPTRAGADARAAWPALIDRIDAAWRDRHGVDAIAALEAALAAAPPATLPWAPPEVHPADGFRTSLTDDALTDDALADDAVRAAPLVARLGQVLTQRTVEHEREAAVSRALAVNLLRVLADDDRAGTPARDLPARAGVSKQAVAMASSYATRHRLAEPAAPGVLRLTDAGRLGRANQRARDEASDDAALRAALDTILSDTDRLRQGLEPPPGAWRAEKPYVAQTRRLLADPLAALPWQPMVLHRGGWPDGS